jgi:3-oxoacyl-[acyl-carrier protein] reductase
MLMANDSGTRRICLLTGAGGRLGADFCRRFGSVYDIVAVCRERIPNVRTQDQWHVDPLDQTREPLPGPIVYTITADLTADGSIERIIELAVARFGRIDVVVNAAAFVMRERLTTLAEHTHFLDRAFNVNATIPIRLAATVARMCWADSSAANRAYNHNVINISSGAGLGVVDAPGLGAYSASKVALNFLTCYLAEELAGISVRVNAIAPTTFPDIIPTEAVSYEIRAVDSASFTGQIVDLSSSNVRHAIHG